MSDSKEERKFIEAQKIIQLIINELGNQKERYKMEEKVNIEWVKIPAGTFKMGSPKSDLLKSIDECQHQVSLSAFEMSKYQITCEQYDKFCEVTGRSSTLYYEDKYVDPNVSRRSFPAEGNAAYNQKERAKYPVINVNWYDASAFAEWIGARLPTEEEWEYACRAGTTTVFNTGNIITTEQANFGGDHDDLSIYNSVVNEKRCHLVPVGSFQPNAWGLYDMIGNVNEWCSDFYKGYSSWRCRLFRSRLDRRWINRYKSQLVYRGGGFNDDVRRCRSASRLSADPSHKTWDIGFRVVRSTADLYVEELHYDTDSDDDNQSKEQETNYFPKE